ERVWVIDRPTEAGLSDRRMTVAGGTLIASASMPAPDDFIAGYDLTTGRELWRTRTDQGSVSGYYGMVTSADNVAYACFTNGFIGAFDVTTGQRLWVRRPPSGMFYGAPVVSHDTLFLGGSEGAYAIAK